MKAEGCAHLSAFPPSTQLSGAAHPLLSPRRVVSSRRCLLPAAVGALCVGVVDSAARRRRHVLSGGESGTPKSAGQICRKFHFTDALPKPDPTNEPVSNISITMESETVALTSEQPSRLPSQFASALPGRYRSRRVARNVHYARTACVSYTGCIRCRASLCAPSRARENSIASVSAIPLSAIFSLHYTPPSPSPLPRPIFHTGNTRAHASRA
ncbi:hypothetical protein HYPSUDRAFT_220948 [Hypholoma sublateritium FD-334 SS-4]|uniref:Uncharacterized protein n=1 Tax=Hypholoma sublateritium (strain FD-334 SS-4) TaxID=945553 RepID=A0A0D2N911_HYPSF|nr:hypothetical protein HYPSUDRAFT_220948 [Hypholoma sublateritium FD-334 SS-4]